MCHITVVDPCYVFWGDSLCAMWALHGSSVNLLIYILVKSEYVSFPIGNRVWGSRAVYSLGQLVGGQCALGML